MLSNGLQLVVDMAVSEARSPVVSLYRDALVLGALREDVRRLPGSALVWEHLSLTHFSGRWLPGGFLPLAWAGPGLMAEVFFRRAVASAAGGRRAEAFVSLGRACHLVIDMACPVHAGRVIHETDPYEWYVEAHAAELETLGRVPKPAASTPAGIVASLARLARTHRADGTRSLHGRWLERLGLRRPVRREEAADQARALIPQAAAHVARLLELFLERSPAGTWSASPQTGAAASAGVSRTPA